MISLSQSGAIELPRFQPETAELIPAWSRTNLSSLSLELPSSLDPLVSGATPEHWKLRPVPQSGVAELPLS